VDQNAAGSSTVVMYIEKLVDWWRVVCTRAVTVSLFPFPVQLRSVFAKKTAVSVFHGFGFFIQIYVYRTTHNVRRKRSNLLLCVKPYTRWTTLLCSFVNWQFM